MENITVKFGTLTPLRFREYDKAFPKVDLELEIRIAGHSDVSTFDSAIYGSDEEIKLKARETALSSLKESINTWPEGKSFFKNTTKEVLEEKIDGSLVEHGIEAKTVITSFVLSPESEEEYRAAVEEATKETMSADAMKKYAEVSYRNEGQPAGNEIERPYMGDLMSPMSGPSSIDGGMKTADNADPEFMSMDPPENLEAMYSGVHDKYCRQCGTKRLGNAKFCPVCGERYK